MGSKHVETRESQVARCVRELEARKALLQERGVAENDTAKDVKVRQIEAKIKQLNGAMARIDFLQQQTKSLKEKKEKAKAEAEAAKAAGESGKKKKKEEKAGKKGKKGQAKGGQKKKK
ncbi:hypothetical protein ACFL2Q_14165 [Thermodesulfobacteriota bacterium]